MTSTPLLASVDSPIAAAWILPFATLLLLIAVMPLSPASLKHHWERHYPKVAIGLGLIVALYYLFGLKGGGGEVVHTLHEYFSFIALIGSLFVVAGGIHISVKGEATPMGNVVFLALGAVLANVIGTTGASMVLIRPWIRMNKVRLSGYHIVFFIFVVSNVGGALTPIGDPPLFLGFLRGVPFFWLIEHVLLQWVVTVGLVIAAFYFFDRRSFSKMPRKLQVEVEKQDDWRFDGGVNVLLLFVIIGSVFLPAIPFLREGIMIAAAVASYKLTPQPVHAANEFSFGPIKEVAFLFLGIFLTMLPALGYLEQHGQEFGFVAPLQYYFGSGFLSSVLDNAPTYVNFLQLAQTTAKGLNPAVFAGPMSDFETVRALLSVRPDYVIAVSLGSVFFGAMTYIGNGPNFMVKSIADAAGAKTPSFFGYIVKYSGPVLFPILALSGWLFLR
ncbi:sodium:proton antiporter [Nibricoccus sp. IMCC34717]|uniref:sodium:proton antiporter n=1 Tax=Nibricoccus sp. IMCC34717 TaxID=3034021 RepID=UPI00384D8760